MNKFKRERGPNWDQEEKIIFIHCFKKVSKILEDSKKDFNTNNRKNQAWLSLLNDFNSHSNVQKVNNLNIDLKKDIFIIVCSYENIFRENYAI